MHPTEAADSRADAHALSGRLLEVAQLAMADFAAAVAELGLTPVQARAVLWLEGPSAMRGLANHLACDASNITGIADRLEEMGVVERIPGEDRRVTILRLTERGISLRADIVEHLGRGSTVTSRLTAAERRQLSGLLDRLLS